MGSVPRNGKGPIDPSNNPPEPNPRYATGGVAVAQPEQAIETYSANVKCGVRPWPAKNHSTKRTSASLEIGMLFFCSYQKLMLSPNSLHSGLEMVTHYKYA